MIPARKRAVLSVAAGGLALVAALAAVTAMVVRQQRAHATAVAQALYHEDLRTAMWRMETRVGTLLATTTNRAPAARSMPEASFASNWIAPRDNVINPVDAPSAELRERVIGAADQAYVLACEIAAGDLDSQAAPQGTLGEQQLLSNRGAARSREEFQQRFVANSGLQNVGVNGVDPTLGVEFCVGPLAPVWEDDEGDLRLHLARRVESDLGVSHESYRLDWTELRATLLALVTDLFPQAELVPIVDPADLPVRSAPAVLEEDDAVRLAAIPARLVVPPPRAAEGLPRGHLWTLGGAWAALLLALGAGGLALRAGYAYGDKHRRFTQTVTHELRTPLTTFRMYSEMLSRGMVDESARAEYLGTLESESARLSALVENVLRYARLEEGRERPSVAVTQARELLERCTPELARAAAAAGAQLEVRDELDDAPLLLRTDAAAVLQILANLVDNACKYGTPAGGEQGRQGDAGRRAPSILLRAAPAGDGVSFEVVDAGPGVPDDVARAIFAPFERGHRDSSDPAPGVGLGLALARGLARELGGDLVLVPSERGACFRLTLPRA